MRSASVYVHAWNTCCLCCVALSNAIIVIHAVSREYRSPPRSSRQSRLRLSGFLLRNVENTLRSSSPLISCAAATGTLSLLTVFFRTAHRLLPAANSRFLASLAIHVVTIVRSREVIVQYVYGVTRLSVPIDEHERYRTIEVLGLPTCVQCYSILRIWKLLQWGTMYSTHRSPYGCCVHDFV